MPFLPNAFWRKVVSKLRITLYFFQITSFLPTNLFSLILHSFLDEEPPKIENCPEDIVKTASSDNRVRVTWKEPRATDNSGDDSVRLFSDRANGAVFYRGSSLVTYIATDMQDNRAFCKFHVIVKCK